MGQGKEAAAQITWVNNAEAGGDGITNTAGIINTAVLQPFTRTCKQTEGQEPSGLQVMNIVLTNQEPKQRRNPGPCLGRRKGK